jgi:hypothetical protein
VIVQRSTNARSKLVAAVAVVSLASIICPASSLAEDFPSAEWARLADSMSQRLECLKIAGKSMAQGMQCKLAQARALPPLDLQHREWFGEFYSPEKYRKCLEEVGSPTSAGGCEFLRLMREPEPEFWPYADARRPRWPAAPNPPTYRKSMTSKEYFAALCKREAGEFIYRVVEEVEGIYQVRPRKRAWNALEDRYVMEDPYGYTNEEAVEPWFVFAGKDKYSFYELPVPAATRPNTESRYWDPSLFSAPPPGSAVARHSGYDGHDLKSMKRTYDSALKSRYGVVWRGISRAHDRELGIAGGELAVVDLRSGEILGLRRGFIASGKARNTRSGIQWEVGAVCPANAAAQGLHKSHDFAFHFASKVLKPAK